MRRSTRNQSFAGSRQKTAIKIIHELTELGISITEISKRTRIATNTISKWFHDSCPNPRTLSRLQALKSKILEEKEEDTKRNEAFAEYIEWEKAGGMERVEKFQDWLRRLGKGEDCELRNDHPNHKEYFAHWEVEKTHQYKGYHLGQCHNKIL